MRPEWQTVEEPFGTPTPQDWELFLKWAMAEGWRVPAQELALYRGEMADSAFVLRGAAGDPLGFVTVSRHQRGAWIGNLIVDPDRRGEGLGRRLFQHAIEVLNSRGAAGIWLTASADGLPLYQSCGFREAGRVERWVRQVAGGEVAPPVASGNSLQQLARADTAAWGGSRVGLLTRLARGGQIFAANGTVALLQAGTGLRVLGPWLTADLCPRSNRSVLAAVLDFCASGEIAVDLLGGSPVRALLAASGFRQTGETVLMLHGAAGAMKRSEIVALASLGSMG